IMAMADFEMDFGYKPQSDTEYRARIYGKNRLKRTIEISINESKLVLPGSSAGKAQRPSKSSWASCSR
ncbi:MAG: hypothetical protein PHV82_14985, partial [Victivallaceae bacterium]|nr:hypothetical protein [Victivallaceae bacterium]